MYWKISGLILLGMSLCAMSADAQGTKATLLECRENGGRTPKGGYFVNMKIRRDGTAQFEDNDRKHRAKLSQADIALLIKEIERADYDAITAKPSGKMSPASYDGTETIYTFYSKGAPHRIPTYKYVVPPKTTLFKTVEMLRKRYKL